MVYGVGVFEKQWFMGLVSVKRVSCYIVDYKVSDAKDRLLVFTDTYCNFTVFKLIMVIIVIV